MRSRAGNHSRRASILAMDETLTPYQLFEGDAIVIHHTPVMFRLEFGQKNPLKTPRARVEREDAGGLRVTNEIQIVIK